MGKLKIKQKKKAFIPYTNQQAHMFAQSIQNCQKELKEMEMKAFDDGFEDGKNWSDVLNFVILFYVMHELHGWGWKRYMKSVKELITTSMILILGKHHCLKWLMIWKRSITFRFVMIIRS